MKNIFLTQKLTNQLPFLFGLMVVLVFFVFNITGYDFSYFPGDMGDARFNNYILEHAHKFFIREEISLWQAPFMYPEKDIISYSDNLIGSALIYSFFRLLSFDRETSFQLWVLFVFVLNYACAYIFLLHQFKNKYAAVIGALVFSCSMSIQSQLTHAQTFPRFPIPLAFLMGSLFMKELKPIYFFGTIFFVVYQFYCGIYLGFFLIVPISLFFLFVLIYKKNLLVTLIKNIRWSLKMIFSIIIGGLILLPLMLPYIERSKLLGMNEYENIFHTIPSIKSFFFSQNGSLIWQSLTETATEYPAFWDHQIFPGGLSMLCMIVFVVLGLIKLVNKKYLQRLGYQPENAIFFVTLFFTFLLFVRFGEFSCYKMIFKIPGFGSLRSLTRIINIELIFFAYVVTYFCAGLLNHFNRYKKLLFLVISVVFVVDSYYIEGVSSRTAKIESQTRVNELIEKMKNLPKGSVVSYQPVFEGNSIYYQIDAMLATQALGLKTINGYNATSPYGYDSFWRKMDDASREEWLKIQPITSEKVHVIH